MVVLIASFLVQWIVSIVNLVSVYIAILDMNCKEIDVNQFVEILEYLNRKYAMMQMIYNLMDATIVLIVVK